MEDLWTVELVTQQGAMQTLKNIQTRVKAVIHDQFGVKNETAQQICSITDKDGSCFQIDLRNITFINYKKQNKV